MIQAIKKEVTVLPGERIEFQVSALTPGTHAEVLVLVPDKKPHTTLVSMIGKGRGGYPSAKQVDEHLHKERDAWE